MGSEAILYWKQVERKSGFYWIKMESTFLLHRGLSGRAVWVFRSVNECQMAEKSGRFCFWILSNKLLFQTGAALVMTVLFSLSVSLFSLCSCLTLIISMSLPLCRAPLCLCLFRFLSSSFILLKKNLKPQQFGHFKETVHQKCFFFLVSNSLPVVLRSGAERSLDFHGSL